MDKLDFVGFYPRPVMAFGYCRCVRLSVCVSVHVCGNNEHVRAITHHPFKLESPNLGQKCKPFRLRSLLFLGLVESFRSNLTSFQNPVYLHRFCVFEIFVRPAKTYENGICSTSKMAPHIYVGLQGHAMDHETVWVVSLVWPLLAFQSSTRWLAMDFEHFCRLSPNYTYLTCPNFVCQHPVMAETTVKQRAFTFILFNFQHWGTRRSLCRRYF